MDNIYLDMNPSFFTVTTYPGLAHLQKFYNTDPQFAGQLAVACLLIDFKFRS